jgi:hypothetical protein
MKSGIEVSLLEVPSSLPRKYAIRKSSYVRQENLEGQRELKIFMRRSIGGEGDANLKVAIGV